MYRHRFYESASNKTYFDWMLLAFLAGSVNTGGFLACHRFVSHVTGFATLVGVRVAHFDWGGALAIASVPMYFLLGTMISAFFIDRRIQENQKPRYGFVMSLVAALLGAAAIGGYLGYFGTFGNELEMSRDYLFLSLLCGASGLQNAALTQSSGGSVRTTHLTGLTTDLGIGVVRMASIKATDVRRKEELRATLLRAGTIASFMTGSAAGALLFLKFAYLGLAMPALIAVYAAFQARAD